MKSRLAYTAGGMVVLTGEGGRARIPAGACWIDGHYAETAFCTVRWSELGMEYSGRLSGVDLRAYVLGCILQYA